MGKTAPAGTAGLQTGTAAAGRVEHLKAKHRALWVWDRDQPFHARTHGDVALRTYRAIRWFERAERESDSGDKDVAFILYWIAFNAAYARDMGGEQIGGERSRFGGYFASLVALDSGSTIHNAIWDRFSGPIRILLNNQYLYGPFWDHANGDSRCDDWRSSFEGSKRLVHRALAQRSTYLVLDVLFERLYTLRNQLVHGGATQNSSLNRDSVRDAAKIMSFLVPVFLQIMLDHPESTWGPAWYPPRLLERPPR